MSVTYYYMQELSKLGFTSKVSNVVKATAKDVVPDDAITVTLGSIKYSDYLNNPKAYYISGNVLRKIKART